MKHVKQMLVIFMGAILIICNNGIVGVFADESAADSHDNNPAQVSTADLNTQIDYEYFEQLGIYHVENATVVENSRSGGYWRLLENGYWRYYHNDGTYVSNAWEYIDGYWYLFNPSGYMHTGWASDNGCVYYLNTESPGLGQMVIGWKYIVSAPDGSRSWYYFNQSGAMVTGWQYLPYNGYNNWYYFLANGTMHTGWLIHNNNKYYLKPNGAMVTGWNVIDGYSYFFDYSGHLKETKRRAIILGDDSVERSMDLNGWTNALTNMTFLDEDFERIETDADLTYSEFYYLLDDVMSDAEESDITYLSITCHGSQQGGIYLCSDIPLSGYVLRFILDQYEGKVVLFLNCCYAGTIINRPDSVYPEMDFLSEFMTEPDSGELLDEKYLVLCSSAYDELSFKYTNPDLDPICIAYANQYWTLGGGWDLVNNTLTTMNADINEDSVVTLDELYNYSYSNISIQHVVVYPSNSDFTIFARN